MNLKKSIDLRIANGLISDLNVKLESLNYIKWVDFVDMNKDLFIWKEETEEGKETLQGLDKVPENFIERVLSTLNKSVCFSKKNTTKNYDISVVFYGDLNWITINFARIPKLEDLEIFVKMANHLDALLLVDGTKVINEEILKDIT
ncbi:MAG: hypothetical protein ACWA41_05755 [Putridiphycobacter sp.]